MPRLFTAIELPDHIRADLARLHRMLPGARWVDPDDYHLTLRFAGDISPSVARDFADAIALIDADVFQARLAGTGAFGGNDPHAIWAGVEPSPSLDALARLHERAARSSGLKPQSRPFKPHITLARLNRPSPELVAGFLAHTGNYRSDPFVVTRTVLLSAKPMTGGGPYALEEAFPLRGAVYYEPDAGHDDAESR